MSLKKVVVSMVSVASALALAAPVSADYPPVEEVKPSTIIKEISFDRSPASVDPSTRKVEAPVAAGATKTVSVYVGETFTPVVPNCPPSTRFRVTITTAGGKSLTLPAVKSLKNGRLRLPSLAISQAGTFTVKATAPNGKVRTIRINAGK